MTSDETELTHDAFLGGRLHLWQPRRGYRAGIDPVLLAAAIPAKKGQSVLELGCGVGTALLCLDKRVAGLSLTGVEVQEDYARLARRNAEKRAEIITADLRTLPAGLRQRQFDHVIMNPPYFDRTKGDQATDPGRDLGRGGDTPLKTWITEGTRRLAPKGHLSLVQHISRLPDTLSALGDPLGSVLLKPISGRQDTPPGLFLLQAKHGGRAPFRMLRTLVLHDGTAHTTDSESYRQEIRAVLRDGAGLPIED